MNTPRDSVGTRLSRIDCDAIDEQVFRLKEEHGDLIECWTLTTATNAPPMFKLYKSLDDSEFAYYLAFVDGGICTSHRFLGLTNRELGDIVKSFEVNPLIVRHRTPGKLLGEPSDGIVTTK